MPTVHIKRMRRRRRDELLFILNHLRQLLERLERLAGQ
jgi:hypothetical protein